MKKKNGVKAIVGVNHDEGSFARKKKKKKKMEISVPLAHSNFFVQSGWEKTYFAEEDIPRRATRDMVEDRKGKERGGKGKEICVCGSLLSFLFLFTAY